MNTRTPVRVSMKLSSDSEAGSSCRDGQGLGSAGVAELTIGFAAVALGAIGKASQTLTEGLDSAVVVPATCRT